jgi:hypothetical protein
MDIKQFLRRKETDTSHANAAHSEQGTGEIFELLSATLLAAFAARVVQTANELCSPVLFLEAHSAAASSNKIEPHQMLASVRTTASILEAALGGGHIPAPAGEDADHAVTHACNGRSGKQQEKTGICGEKEAKEPLAAPSLPTPVVPVTVPIACVDLTEQSPTANTPEASAAGLAHKGVSGGGLGADEGEMMVGPRVEWTCLLPWPMPFKGSEDESKQVAAACCAGGKDEGFDMRDIVFETVRGSPILPRKGDS